MSKKHQEIFSNQSTEHENSILSKTGYSNSRLSGQTLGKSQPKLSFDAMTIVGNLNKNNAHKLSEFMSAAPEIRLWDILQTKFISRQSHCVYHELLPNSEGSFEEYEMNQ